MASTRDAVIDALHASHRRLAMLDGGLDGGLDEGADLAARQSYCTDWTVGQVLTHIGSGSEIFDGMLEAGAQQRPAPDSSQWQPVWDRWSVLAPDEQIHRGVEASRSFLEHLDAFTEEEGATPRGCDVFGAERDLEGLARLRLSEHVVHTWDAVVVLEPTAVLDSEPVGLILDQLGWIIGYVGKPSDTPTTVRLTATDLDRTFLLDIGAESVVLTETAADVDAAGQLAMPGEAIVRLVYGRLDPDHTPAIDIAGVDLDFLRDAPPAV